MKDNKKAFVLSIIAVVTLLILIIGATFAYFAAQVASETVSNIRAATATTDVFTFTTGDKINFSINQDNFASGNDSLSSTTFAKASLTANNSTNSAIENYYLYFTIELNTFDYSINSTTPEVILNVLNPDGEEVTSIDGLTYYDNIKDNKNNTITGFNITTSSGLIVIADNKEIKAGSANGKDTTVEENWEITLTFVNYNADQSKNAEASINAKLLIQKTPAFADKILLDEANTDTIKAAKLYVQNKGTPDFSQNATTDEGIFATTDEDGTVYYFRGAVDDNHVLFGGFCWRIVRTTGTGGVKILYDGLPSSNGSCDNTGSATTMGNYQFNTKYNSPAYVGYMYGETSTSSSVDVTTLTGSVVFGNSVTYDEITKTYTLVDTYTIKDSKDWANEYTNVVKKHYTCFSSSNTCESVNYVNTIYSVNKYCSYVALSNGETQLDVLEKTLVNVENTNESNIKKNIDSWFKANLSNVEEYLEDTVFCNDREYYNLSTSGWNKDYSNYSGLLYFKSRQRQENKKPSLSCSRTIDKFTVSEEIGNGDLTYPVGLITADEMTLAGGVFFSDNTSYYLYNGVYSWSLSPYNFDSWVAAVFTLDDSGDFSYDADTRSVGARPMISLTPGLQVESGDGSKTSPYILS